MSSILLLCKIKRRVHFHVLFFLKSSDATDRTIAGGVVKDGAELDFSSFETGETAVLVEDFSMPVTQVITNFFSHN